MMDSYILAHGPAERWTDLFSARIARFGHVPQFKHLLTIAGMPLPVASATMLNYLTTTHAGFAAPSKLVATWEIRQRIKFESAATYVHVPTVIHTMFACFSLSHPDASLFLLGDVLYDPDDLVKIVSTPAEIAFLGRVGANTITGKPTPELFAVHVRSSGYRRFLDALTDLIYLYEVHRVQVKLWHLLRRLSGVDPESSEVPRDLLIDAEGYTDDVDTIDEFERYWPRLRQAAEADYAGL